MKKRTTVPHILVLAFASKSSSFRDTFLAKEPELPRKRPTVEARGDCTLGRSVRRTRPMGWLNLQCVNSSWIAFRWCCIVEEHEGQDRTGQDRLLSVVPFLLFPCFNSLPLSDMTLDTTWAHATHVYLPLAHSPLRISSVSLSMLARKTQPASAKSATRSASCDYGTRGRGNDAKFLRAERRPSYKQENTIPISVYGSSFIPSPRAPCRVPCASTERFASPVHSGIYCTYVLRAMALGH